MLKKYMLEEPSKADTESAMILTSTTTPDVLKPPSILKSVKPHVMKPQKSVSISEEAKAKNQNMNLHVKRNSTLLSNNTKSKIGFLEKFKTLVHKIKSREKSPPRIIQSKDPLSEPQLEQYRFLNGNLNAWESEEEKLSRLRARRRQSLKGLTLRKKVKIIYSKKSNAYTRQQLEEFRILVF